MYPDLSYILHDVFGTSVDNWSSIVKTFGLFLALAFLVAAWILNLELKRKEKEGLLTPGKIKVKVGEPASMQDILVNGVIGFFIGFKILYAILNFDEFQADAAGVILSGKGNFLGGLIGALLSGGFRWWTAKKEQLKKPVTKEMLIHPYQRTGDITIVAAISGLIGAKLFSVFENLDAFFADPVGQFFSGSGLTIYGGLILAFIVVAYYLKKKGIPVIHAMDAVAPALIVAYGVGRMGCHFSGDGDWGIVNELAKPSWFFLPEYFWANDYAHNVINEGVRMSDCSWKYCYKLAQPVYPTPIWETFLAMLIGAILWVIRKRIKVAGVLFFIYVFFNGIERFFIESIRVNPRYAFLGVNWSQAQYIAILLILTGIAGIVYLLRRNKQKTLKT